MKNNWHIISYYTPDYADVIKRLEKSLLALSLSYTFYAIDDQGTWYANTEYKARVIDKALREMSKLDIVFIDADAEVLRYPVLFDTLECDVAAHLYRGSEFQSGTLYFKNNDMARRIVERWIELNEAKPTSMMDLEQRRLHKAILELRPIFVDLPHAYCYIFDCPFSCKDPVIVHYQQSRKTRQKGLTRKFL